MSRRHRFRWAAVARWLVLPFLASLVLLLFHLSAAHPESVENLYSRGLFPVVRFILDHTIGLLPFSGLYLLFVGLGVLLVLRLKRRLDRDRNRGGEKSAIGKNLGRGLWALFQAASIALILGYMLWGFNYNRVPFEISQNWELRPLRGPDLLEALTAQVERLNALRTVMTPAEREPISTGALEKSLRGAYRTVLGELELPGPWSIRLRTIWPGGLMMAFGVAGMYNPFLGEATVPHTLHPCEKPFCAAHELAHACGVAEEGSANFLAYMACSRSSVPAIRYSADLALFQYLLGECPPGMSGAVADVLRPLHPLVRHDLREIRENWGRYRSWLTSVGNRMNDLYLRAQGIPEGVRSYNRFLILYKAWKSEDTVRAEG